MKKEEAEFDRIEKKLRRGYANDAETKEIKKLEDEGKIVWIGVGYRWQKKPRTS
jgi:hypothetical protein